MCAHGSATMGFYGFAGRDCVSIFHSSRLSHNSENPPCKFKMRHGSSTIFGLSQRHSVDFN